MKRRKKTKQSIRRLLHLAQEHQGQLALSERISVHIAAEDFRSWGFVSDRHFRMLERIKERLE